MKHTLQAAMLLVSLMMNCVPNETVASDVRLRILHTSDVHGHVLDALPRIARYVELSRRQLPDGVIVTDGGDVLQGHPAAYFFNYIDTASTHLVAAAMNRIGYDVGAIGNHDIEAGHAVYDRWVADCRFPIIGANVVDANTGKPYLKPYTVVERSGVRVAFLGLLTPAIPNWVPQGQWTGLSFEECVATARHWVPLIMEREHPDILVGLFHSGWDAESGIRTQAYMENASRLVAEAVPGLDIVLYGHDHRRHVERVAAPAGAPSDSVLCIGPTSNGGTLCQVDIVLRRDAQGRLTKKELSGTLLSMSQMDSVLAAQHAPALAEPWFEPQQAAVQAYMDEEVGVFDTAVYEREAFFGPSAFIDLIHELQLSLSQGAQISFAAPLSYDAVIPAGTVHVSDMFKLYKYENLLYTMRLTGREIRNFLEMSYGQWVQTMRSPSDHIMLLDSVLDNGHRLGFKNMAFNFDSAAGIRYTVDVSQPEGQRVNIECLADGSPFSLNASYLVAMNSYRGNGGGELLTRGAGIALNDIPSRIVGSTTHDLRYHLIHLIRQRGHVKPQANHNWRFVPESLVQPALQRDRLILFPNNEQGWQH